MAVYPYVFSNPFETEYVKHPSGASMSLVGLVPPLSDNGRVLVDGGYGKFITYMSPIHPVHTFTVDNLPVSTMMRLGASTVFAVDAGSVSNNIIHNKGILLNPRFQLVG
jgi:lysophospholipid hydrolase